jgi:hypothetical protein
VNCTLHGDSADQQSLKLFIGCNLGATLYYLRELEKVPCLSELSVDSPEMCFDERHLEEFTSSPRAVFM